MSRFWPLASKSGCLYLEPLLSTLFVVILTMSAGINAQHFLLRVICMPFRLPRVYVESLCTSVKSIGIVSSNAMMSSLQELPLTPELAAVVRAEYCPCHEWSMYGSVSVQLSRRYWDLLSNSYNINVQQWALTPTLPVGVRAQNPPSDIFSVPV